jgi:hypothetical protein
LLDDVKSFLDLQSQAWYQGRGVVRISAALPELAIPTSNWLWALLILHARVL